MLTLTPKMMQVDQLQCKIDAAYKECFESASRSVPDELEVSIDLPDISEASFGNLGRTDPEVRHHVYRPCHSARPMCPCYCLLRGPERAGSKAMNTASLPVSRTSALTARPRSTLALHT